MASSFMKILICTNLSQQLYKWLQGGNFGHHWRSETLPQWYETGNGRYQLGAKQLILKVFMKGSDNTVDKSRRRTKWSYSHSPLTAISDHWKRYTIVLQMCSFPVSAVMQMIIYLESNSRAWFSFGGQQPQIRFTS